MQLGKVPCELQLFTAFQAPCWSRYLLALLDSVQRTIGQACAVLVIYIAQAELVARRFGPPQVVLPVFDEQFESRTFISVMVRVFHLQVVCFGRC